MTVLLERIQSLGSVGWSGPDPVEKRLADSISKRLEGRHKAAIGYHIRIWPFMAAYNAVDRRYKVGANLDLFFKTLNGISNTDDCAEGFSPADEFRIVNIESGPGDPRKTYFDISLDNFHLVEQLGPYQLFQRF